MVTIKDVARVAGVSPSTVSRVARGDGKVGPECRAKVQKIIDEMGYRPNTNARALVSQHAEIVGLITPNYTAPFFGKLAQGVESASRDARYKIMMSSSSEDSEESLQTAINSLLDAGCENIILHSKKASNEKLIALSERIKGLIVINRCVPGIEERCVWMDNSQGGRDVANYLLAKGHRDIQVITTSLVQEDALARLNGMKQALAEQGVQLKDEDVIWLDLPTDTEEAVKKLIESGKKYTVLAAFNDAIAIRAIDEYLANGVQIPEELSIIGFDDLIFATIRRPHLTTMRYPLFEMGAFAAELSISLTNPKAAAPERSNLFTAELVKRQSLKDLTA